MTLFTLPLNSSVLEQQHNRYSMMGTGKKIAYSLLLCVISPIPKGNLSQSFYRGIRESRVNHTTVPLQLVMIQHHLWRWHFSNVEASSCGIHNPAIQHLKHRVALGIVQIVPFKYLKGLKHHEGDLRGDSNKVMIAERASLANIFLKKNSAFWKHTCTFLLPWSLLVDSFDNYNLHCICYNWPLSLETDCSEPLFPILWATTVQHLRQKNSRLDSPLMTSRVKKHKTLKKPGCPDIVCVLLCLLPSIKPI